MNSAQNSTFAAADLSKEQFSEMLRKMLQIRWFDRMMADKALTVPGYRGSPCNCAGQEGVAVGVSTALNKDDWIVCTHRALGQAIAKGADIKKLAAEFCRKSTGTNHGYGGGLHIMQREVGILFTDAVVGVQAGHGAGAAFGIRARGTKQVVVAYGGEGHITSPYCYMALFNAAKWKLPFIYVIERNVEAATRSWSEVSHLENFADLAKGFDVPAVIVDGQPAIEVYNVTKTAVDRARAGEGPTLIEAKTYKYGPFAATLGLKPGVLGAFGLPWRSDRELQYWLAKDPIDIHRRVLINMGILTDAEADELEAKVKQEIEEAFKFADESPVPNPEDGLKHVYVEGTVLPRQLPDCPLY